jgi:hypothetical protein
MELLKRDSCTEAVHNGFLMKQLSTMVVQAQKLKDMSLSVFALYRRILY